MGNRMIVLVIVSLLACLPSSSEPGERSRVVIGSAGDNMPPTLVSSAILAEAYDKAGYSAEFTVYPPKRMIASLKMGTIDAIVLAESGLEGEIPGVIRIVTPVWIDELAVISKDYRPVRSWDELKGLRVGYLTAMLIIENNVPTGAERFPSQTVEQLFRMLDTDRTDVVVTSRTIAKYMIARLGLANVRYAGDTLATVNNYHFVSNRNSEVAVRVSAALAEMERSGRIAEIARETLERLFGEAER